MSRTYSDTRPRALRFDDEQRALLHRLSNADASDYEKGQLDGARLARVVDAEDQALLASAMRRQGMS